jgi:uncharacterized protein (DUF1800 family)
MSADTSLCALNRFGLGARAGERARLSDPKGWLRRQLRGGPPLLAAPSGVTSDGIGAAMRGLRQVARGNEAERRQARRRLVELGTAELRHAFTARVASDRPFVERLVAFWSNHLCVSMQGKAQVAPLTGSYEREAIRPHVLGRFEDLVLASAKHPAMLIYLDNAQSIGPRSQGAGRAERSGQRRGGRPGASQQPAVRTRRGLNENYARELLELHTLGVDGGYSQRDVQELAKVLTGWSIDGFGGAAVRLQAVGRGRRASARAAGADLPSADGPVRFAFQDVVHEPGAKTVLGATYEQAGMLEGERAIKALCAHPATAQFVARKLVTHFVSDDPPPAAVERIARVFRATGGDLAAVSDALIDLPEAWDEQHRKFRTPQDWLVAVFRGLGVAQARENVGQLLRQLRQPLWAPPSPKGYGDSLREWADPDSLLNRGELARTVAALPRLRDVDPRVLLDVVEVPPNAALSLMLADNTIPRDERVALALAGPAFQWR